ncbi:MAG: GTP-binding protein [Eubacteriales bacterium]|nr:GTP-binding protein [Eubacteriales bacterium]
MTKIDIISGFLGAGKTTLIKKLIAEGFQGEKLVLIENEFGEIGIDGGFLKDAGVQINEMNSGCICCSLVGDFGKALKQVLDEYTPDRIIIEPSGVGKLSDVMKAVSDMEETDISIHSASAVVDATKCKMYMKNFGEFFNNQIESAGTIILSRSQKLNDDKLQAVVDMIKEKNDKATIITTPWDDIDGKQIVNAMEHEKSLVEELMEEAKVCPTCGHVHEHHHEEEHHHHHDEECCHEEHHHHDGECCCGHDHHHHHADEVFTSWGVETPRKYTKEDMENILKVLADAEHPEYGIILRAKGIVPGEDGEWIYFDLTPEEYEIRVGQPEITGKLCVIGSELKEDKIAELFHVHK